MVTNIGDQAFVYDFKQEQEIWWQVIIIIRQFTKFSNGQIKIFIKYTPTDLGFFLFLGRVHVCQHCAHRLKRSCQRKQAISSAWDKYQRMINTGYREHSMCRRNIHVKVQSITNYIIHYILNCLSFFLWIKINIITHSWT